MTIERKECIPLKKNVFGKTTVINLIFLYKVTSQII